MRLRGIYVILDFMSFLFILYSLRLGLYLCIYHVMLDIQTLVILDVIYCYAIEMFQLTFMLHIIYFNHALNFAIVDSSSSLTYLFKSIFYLKVYI